MKAKKASKKRKPVSEKKDSKHQWVKVNLVTQKDKSGMFDLYRCTNCDLTFKRRGLGWNPPDKPCEKKAASIVKVMPELPKVTKEEAQTRTVYIQSLYKKMGSTWWEIGEEVERAVNDRVPEALGKSFSLWAEEIFGEGWLRIRRAFLAVKATKALPHEKRVQISEGNAYHFAHLPEKERESAEWVKKAISMDNDAFKAATDKFIEKKTGIKDPMMKITEALGFSTVPKSFYEIVGETMKLAAQVLNANLETKQGRIDCVEGIFAEYLTAYTNAEGQESAGAEVTG